MSAKEAKLSGLQKAMSNRLLFLREDSMDFGPLLDNLWTFWLSKCKSGKSGLVNVCKRPDHDEIVNSLFCLCLVYLVYD